MYGLDFGLTTVAGQRRVTGFSPLSLPGLIAWFDPSDVSTLFQDAAMTVPVSADGDPVGAIMDKSGNGYHATQSSAAIKPVYRSDGTIEFDGVDSVLVSSVVTAATNSAVLATSFEPSGATPTSNGAIIGDADYQNGGMQLGWGGTNFHIVTNGAGTVNPHQFSATISTTQRHVIGAYTGAASFVYLTGEGEISNPPDFVYGQPAKALSLGRGTQGGRDGFFSGKFRGAVYAQSNVDEARLVMTWLENT